MKVLDLFSGICGFGLAFQKAGFEHLAFCEQDKDCQRVIRRHFPNVEIISDVKEINKERFAFIPDVICGGFPCQDVSVAGKRAGLAGERSGLWFEFRRIIESYQPRWVVIENVPGLLSSAQGDDFRIILQGLAECGYLGAWRVLDSQFDGVAQRRRRVFIVAGLGIAGERAAKILFEREGGCWDSPPRREAGQDVAATIRAGAASRSADAGQSADGMPGNLVTCGSDGLCGNCGRDARIPSRMSRLSELASNTLNARSGGCERGRASNKLSVHVTAYGGNNQSGPIAVATACNAHGGTGRLDYESETFLVSEIAATLNSGGNDGGFRTEPGEHLVAHTLSANGADASEDGTGRGTPIVAQTITAHQFRSNGATAGNNGQPVNLQVVPFDTTQITSKENGSQPQPDDPCHPLAAGVHAPAIAFMNRGSNVAVGEAVTGTLGTNADRASGGAPCVAFTERTRTDGRNFEAQTELAYALTDASKGGNPHSGKIAGQFGVRRLMPVECERLQGFPDRWTATDGQGKPISDSARYRMLGNAVCVPTAEWIARRIAALGFDS